MTVHSAKGLEFDVVFLSGLEEELFPHGNSLSESGGLEEERRLMYVAVTRARKRLYLSCAQSRALHGQTHYHLRSRFLDEVPPELVKWLTPGTRFGGGAFWSPARVDEPPAPSSSRVLPGGFAIGQNVRHARFGVGVIVAAEGGGEDAKVQINFGDAGVKWLLLSLARLEAM